MLALDLLGFGLTDKPTEETYRVRRLASFVLNFMSALGLSRAHLVGSSLGGRIALECALVAPERVSSLLLVDPAGVDRRGGLLEFRLASVPLVGEVLMRPTHTTMRMLWRKAFANPIPFVTEDMITTKVALARMAGVREAFLKTLRGLMNIRGFKPGPVRELQHALPSITAPALVIWGRDDRLVPSSHATILERLLPHVQVQVWDDCGHLPQIEHSTQFNKAALAFWGGLSRNER